MSSRTSLLDHSRRVPIFFTAIFHLRLSCLVEALITWAMVEFRSNRKINNQQRPHGTSFTTASLAFRESWAIHALLAMSTKKTALCQLLIWCRLDRPRRQLLRATGGSAGARRPLSAQQFVWPTDTAFTNDMAAMTSLSSRPERDALRQITIFQSVPPQSWIFHLSSSPLANAVLPGNQS